jgi:histidine phosphotransferase ChpT
MTISAELRVVELLAARLCHDLISPITAVANGAELLAEDDPTFVREAAALVGQSARTAGARLQFCRFAYGFAGGGLAGPAPHELAGELFADSAILCDYSRTARELPLPAQQLACAMLVVAAEALPRGGRVVVGASAAGPEIDAAGDGIGLSTDRRAALSLAVEASDLTTRTVAAYFAGLLALTQDRRITIAGASGGFRLAVARQ